MHLVDTVHLEYWAPARLDQTTLAAPPPMEDCHALHGALMFGHWAGAGELSGCSSQTESQSRQCLLVELKCAVPCVDSLPGDLRPKQVLAKQRRRRCKVRSAEPSSVLAFGSEPGSPQPWEKTHWLRLQPAQASRSLRYPLCP